MRERERHERRDHTPVEQRAIEAAVERIEILVLALVEHQKPVVLAGDVPERPQARDSVEDQVRRGPPEREGQPHRGRADEKKREAPEQQPLAIPALLAIQVGARQRREDVRAVEADDPHPPQHLIRHLQPDRDRDQQVGRRHAAEQPAPILLRADDPALHNLSGLSDLSGLSRMSQSGLRHV